MNVDEIIKYEYNLYFPSVKQYIKEKLLDSDTYRIYKWQVALRKEEYYLALQKHNNLFLPLVFFYRRRKNKLGRALGFDIPAGVIEPGLHIWHASPVVINPYAKIGKNATIVGNLCVGSNKGDQAAARIGDNCTFGWGGAVIGDVKIPDHCLVGAGAIVVKDVCEEGAVMVGIPAKNIGGGMNRK